jgi:CBS domain containing-hemolysin-like protein
VAVPADELRQIAEDSAAEGQITVGESKLLSRVFTFSDRVAREIMVPRNKVCSIDLGAPVAESLALALESGHSRLPLCEGDLDRAVGVVHMKDLTRRLVEGSPLESFRELGRPPLYVPETQPADELLRLLQRKHSHMALVLDEYGGVSGVITIEDALEELVGEIQDEHDEEVPPVIEIEGGWSVEGRLPLSAFCELAEVAPPESEAATLGGYVMERLGRLAQEDDEIVVGPWRLRVSQIDRRAVERIEITRRPCEEPSS